MYWKPEYSSDFSALFLTAENAAEEMYLLNDSTCGDIHLAVPSACTSMQNHFFYIPAGIAGGLTAVYAQSTLEWVMKQQVNFIQMMMLFAVLGILAKYSKQFLSGKVEAAV